MKKHYPMNKNSIKEYINHTFSEAVAGNEEFWYANQHLVCITNYTTIECSGDIPEGTERCIGYFVFNYVCVIDDSRVDNTDKEVEELSMLTSQDYEEIYEYVMNHPHFCLSKEWFNNNQLW